MAGLAERWKVFLSVLAGLDDPQGDYLFRLEERVRRLETEVGALRSNQPGSRDAPAADLQTLQ